MCQPVGFALGDCCRAILALAREREWIPLPASWQVELVSGERHRLLPTPKCRGCSSLESVSNAGSMLHAVSPRLGLIHRVMDLPCENRSLVARRAIGAHTDRLAGVRAANHGMAVDEDADRAMARAVGEALERYCSSFAAGHLPRRRPDELAGECVVPDSLIPGTRADRTSTACAWIEGMRVSDGCGVWLPAALVHFPYIDDGEEPIPQIQSSTGLACGQDFNEAIEHAFGEVIERDAFMRAWRGRLPVTRIPPAPGTFEGLHLIRLPGSHGFEVVTALLESEERPFTAVGIAGRRTMGDAVRSATSEALAVREWLREWLDTNPEAPSFPPRRLEDHARVHAVQEELREARRRWLSAPFEEVDMDRLNEPEAVQQPAFAVDLTTADVAQLGLHVVRVLVPGCVPLDHDALQPILAGDPMPHPAA